MHKKIKLFDPAIGISEEKEVVRILRSGYWASGAGSASTAALIVGGSGPPGRLTLTEEYNGTIWTEKADLNVAKPLESILALAFSAVDGEPAILDGVLILLAVISPCTVKVLPANCKYCPAALSPIKVVDPVN